MRRVRFACPQNLAFGTGQAFVDDLLAFRLLAPVPVERNPSLPAKSSKRQSRFFALPRKGPGMNIEAVDLFCGAGGLSYGLQEAGIKIRAGLDLDGKCRFPFEPNMPGANFLKQDLASTDGDQLWAFYSEGAMTLLAGCAPCQPFSTLRTVATG